MRQALRPLLAAAAVGAACAAPAAFAADYATVVSSTPVTAAVPVQRQSCTESQQIVQPQPSGAGALIGAIAGGVLGNSVGGGFGRAAATGLGAVAGGAIGNQAELSNNRGQTVPTRSCRTVNGYENRVVGYDVVYEYHGQRYTTRMANDPGPRIAIDVRPSAQAPLDQVGPPARYGSAVPAYEQPSYQQPGYASEPSYVESSPSYYAAPPAYYAPAPVYYPRPYVVAPPVIGIGFYGGYGWHGGRHWH